jgi:hypothetical protein
MDQPGNHILLRGNQPAAADRMRELLARTVQDQFADQRSNAGAIDDIRQRMEGLEWLVKEVREREIPGMTAQLDGLARQLEETGQGALGGRVDEVGGQLTDQLEPLADELRSRPGHIEIQETLAKIVDAAQSDVATQLGSLEETVLTLAEALLRPPAPQIPAPREASREASRDGSREGSRI